jgi:predicted RNase H-like HicB family nuclease
MKYTVVLTEKVDGNIHVTVPGLPDCIVDANTRNEALAKTRETISEIISRSEIVQLDLSVEPKSRNLLFNPPWEWFGRFKDIPAWGKMFDEIEPESMKEC